MLASASEAVAPRPPLPSPSLGYPSPPLFPLRPSCVLPPALYAPSTDALGARTVGCRSLSHPCRHSRQRSAMMSAGAVPCRPKRSQQSQSAGIQHEHPHSARAISPLPIRSSGGKTGKTFSTSIIPPRQPLHEHDHEQGGGFSTSIDIQHGQQTPFSTEVTGGRSVFSTSYRSTPRARRHCQQPQRRAVASGPQPDASVARGRRIPPPKCELGSAAPAAPSVPHRMRAVLAIADADGLRGWAMGQLGQVGIRIPEYWIDWDACFGGAWLAPGVRLAADVDG